MGACAGKKRPKPSITPTVATEIEAEGNPFGGENADITAVRQVLEVSEGKMNRRVKSCYENVLKKESEHTTELSLKFVNLGPEGIRQLSQVLPFYPSLQSLRLWKTRISDSGCTSLSRALPRLPALILLSLEDNDIGPAGISHLAEGLKAVGSMEELYLHLNKLGPEGGTTLAGIVGTYRKLKSLTVDENSLGDSSSESLLRSLLKSSGSLRMIGLSFNRLSDSAANFLLRHIRNFPELKRVALNGNAVSEKVRESLITDAPQVAFDF